MSAHSGVRITPGATALTRIGANSTASAGTAALVAPHFNPPDWAFESDRDAGVDPPMEFDPVDDAEL